MRKRYLLSILFTVILLSACALKEDLGEKFLQNHNEEDYKQIVVQANYLLFGNIAEFAEPQELSMRNILNLYLKLNPSFTDGKTIVELNDLEQFAREYFAEDIYDYAKLKDDLAAMSPEFSEDRLIFSREVPLHSPYKDDKISIENTGSDGDKVEIAALLEMKDTPDPIKGKLTLKITEDGYQFLSYALPRAPFNISDVHVSLSQAVSEEQLEDYFGEIKSVEKFEVYHQDDGRRYLTEGGTEISLWYFSGEEGNIFQIVTSDPAIELVKGIKVGDSLESVIGKFADSGYEIAYDEFLGEYRLLYGEIIHMASYGCITYENGEAKEVIYNQEGTNAILAIKDNLVSKVTVFEEF